jgi:hypothetical protein
MQHHAWQRPPLALAPMRPLARRLGRQPRPLQMQPQPSVAPAEAMVPHQMLVEMLDREALIALAIKPLHLLRPVGEAGLAVFLVSSASSAETSVRSPQATQPPPPD